jgi:type III pantothenate kinase
VGVADVDREMGGGSSIMATGGLGGLFLGLCESISTYEPTLTLEGLLIADARLGK